jgi:hypothetical protein
MTTGDLFIAVLLLLGGAKAARAASSSAPTTKQKKAADAIDRVAGLQARANQACARAWIPDLIAAGASPELAAMLSRWIGLESSGNPSKPSSAGEYGLLQILPSTAKEALTPGEWLQLRDPTTSRADQAAIALKQYRWHVANAKKWVKNWPGEPDAVFYAKMSHARPADLSSAKPDGAAAPVARAMVKGTNDPDKLLRLAAASVVRWGTVVIP